MRNACFLLSGYSAKKNEEVLNAFSQSGYFFDDVIFCPSALSGEKSLLDLIEKIKEFDAVALLCESSALDKVKNALLSAFNPTYTQLNEQGAGIYSNAQNTVFLLKNEKEYADFVSRYALPYLTQKHGVRVDKTVIRAVCADEKAARSHLEKIKCGLNGNIRLNYLVDADDYSIELTFDATVPKILVDDVVREILDGLGASVYALEDISIEERLVQLLKLRGLKISVAESFTGGGIAKKITSISGASEVYFEGLNTYNELSKIERLGVSEHTLKMDGAVSDKTAYEMAAGLLASGNVDVSIATTGIAGPKSDRTNFPVGLSYIAVGTKERVFVYKFNFDGDRASITNKAIHHALFLTYLKLKEI